MKPPFVTEVHHLTEMLAEIAPWVLIAIAGLWAGMINTVVGSGTLVTFPVLVALGYPPVTATISNAVGLVPGNAAGAWGYRKQLRGMNRLLFQLLPASLLGGLVGSWLLLHLPAGVFSVVAPVLIVIALALVILQPWLQGILAGRNQGGNKESREDSAESVETVEAVTGSNTPNASLAQLSRIPAPIVLLLVFLTGVYGGYFVAAQGVILIAIMGVFLNIALQTANAIKNILVLGINILATASYSIFAFDRIAWPVAGVIAVTSVIGSLLGARIGQRLSPQVLRAVIVVGVIGLGFMVMRLATQ